MVDFLINNPFTTIPGPEFLVFFGIVALVVLLFFVIDSLSREFLKHVTTCGGAQRSGSNFGQLS